MQPKQRKYRKEFRGKMGGVATSNNELAFGEYGLKSVDRGWVHAREIEAARRAITGHIKRKGKVWIKIFPHKPYTKKPNNVKMIGGKGDLEGYVAVVVPGTILFEMSGVDEVTAREALRLAAHKLSVLTKFVTSRR
ncbi:MAG: 50S ribosomal protein L16 [candidate division WS6 bacterium GW2011_GWF2_39_15]|uniref:50S ribosomal protein L16 n=1 Tax=candidate division WS6 bacterium GW2011_GWF2_39_15 TaxID=1619100 RepID=A0A0G0MR91_9BACT|nr:MAG: 50S ribosomal protein L16 [candidate division WS6 bacterium GW2011_GWF2_39_15]